MPATKTHTYKGIEIVPCERDDHRPQWRIKDYHPRTGLPYSDDDSPHFHRLADAKAAIDQDAIVDRGE